MDIFADNYTIIGVGAGVGDNYPCEIINIDTRSNHSNNSFKQWFQSGCFLMQEIIWLIKEQPLVQKFSKNVFFKKEIIVLLIHLNGYLF